MVKRIKCTYNKFMRIEYDEAKRAKTLQERGLDFVDAVQVFADSDMTQPDGRANYGEARFVTVGWLKGRVVVLAWTPRGEVRRIISMRYANERERTKFQMG